MDSRKQKLKTFVEWFESNISGDEKGEGQIFFDRLFQAFGNPGVKEVGAVCEERIKKRTGSTGFADLIWKPRVIIELKKRSEPLHKHYDQAFEYWLTSVPDRPQYMILCNFDEFWIYDLNIQLNDPVHKLKTIDLPEEWGALAFLFPKAEKAIFNNNSVEVTEYAAKILGSMFLSLTKRNVDPVVAQKFVLQLVVALFAEDVDLIPKYTLNKILQEAIVNPVTQKELTELFEAMSTSVTSKKGVKYKNIDYFNGGLFNTVEAVELTFEEIDLLYEASKQNWSKIRPSIFGAIFESSMDQNSRHGHGVHYTSELDIQKIVGPTIIKPFKEKILKSKSNKERIQILDEIRNFKVLDPACGSGNFLYIAFRELVRLEFFLLELIEKKFDPNQLRFGMIPLKNFHGIDINKFGIELAKVSLSIGRKLAADEFNIHEKVIPFDNLDKNFQVEDALLASWPRVDAIIGNPPFLSSKFMKVELNNEYVDVIRKKYNTVPGRADFCVYWIKKAHDHLSDGQRAGLVGTNTIRQNYSRIGGLDYVLANGGTITEAVGTQVWSGDASVHVSVVNWIKGSSPGEKKLFIQNGDRIDSPWSVFELDTIPSTLSHHLSTTEAAIISANRDPKTCHVGQAPQSEGFYLNPSDKKMFIESNSKNSEVIFPFLIGREMLSKDGKPKRFVIDLGQRDMLQSKAYKEIFSHLEKTVYLDVKSKSEEEIKKAKAEIKKLENEIRTVNKLEDSSKIASLCERIEKLKKNGDWTSHLNNWWKHWRNRPELISLINGLSRYIAISRVTKRPILQFISSEIHPGDALTIFTFEDDYSFGILQSCFHTEWFREKCSTLKGDWRYTADTVYDTFPWPQSPSLAEVKLVAEASRALRSLREQVMKENGWGLKDLYQTLDTIGSNPLATAHENLDRSVRKAYGFETKENLFEILSLNKKVSEDAKSGQSIQKPGLPTCVKEKASFISKDCVTADK